MNLLLRLFSIDARNKITRLYYSQIILPYVYHDLTFTKLRIGQKKKKKEKRKNNDSTKEARLSIAMNGLRKQLFYEIKDISQWTPSREQRRKYKTATKINFLGRWFKIFVWILLYPSASSIQSLPIESTEKSKSFHIHHWLSHGTLDICVSNWRKSCNKERKEGQKFPFTRFVNMLCQPTTQNFPNSENVSSSKQQKWGKNIFLNFDLWNCHLFLFS